MEKEIKRYGNSVVIILTAEERKINQIAVGDIVDFEIKSVETREPYRDRS